jgi:hypothetical protein
VYNSNANNSAGLIAYRSVSANRKTKAESIDLYFSASCFLEVHVGATAQGQGPSAGFRRFWRFKLLAGNPTATEDEQID